MELLCGQMVANIKENLKIIILKALAITYGSMVESMRAHGGIIKCTEEEFSFGQMAENMKDNT